MDRPLSLPPELSLRLAPSRLAQGWCLAVAGLAALAIILAGIPLLLKSLLLLLVGWRAARAITAERRLHWRGILLKGGQWQLQDCAGNVVPVQRGAGGYCGFGLVVLPLLLPCGKRVDVLVWPDSADAENRRQLRVMLPSRSL